MYSFEPTQEQQMLVEACSDFARNHLRPVAHEMDESSQLSMELVQKGRQLGLLQASIPESFGGFGDHSALTSLLAFESLAHGDLAAALAIELPNLFALPILLCGSNDQKKKFLPGMVSSNWSPYTAALIEPAFDFDAHALKTAAALRSGEFVLRGEKIFVPFAADAPAMIVYAELDGRTEGFIVERDTPGMTIAAEPQKLMSLNALPLYRVVLDEVTVDAANRLGRASGLDLELVLASMRIASAAAALGVANAAFEYARDYAKQREAFGVKIAQKQAIAFMLAEMRMEIEAMRLLAWEAAWKLDRHRDDACSGAYLAATGAAEMAMTVTDRAVQILGGHGFIREHPVERWLRNARGLAALTGIAMV